MTVTDASSPQRRTRARRGQGELLRADILEAAEKLLIATGDADAVSIRAVAKAVGVTPPSIYLHFADKTELIFQVCQVQWDRFNDHVRGATEGITDPVQRLRACGLAYIDFALENPEQYRILFMSRVREQPAGVDMEDLLTSSIFGDLVTAVHEAAARGLLVGDPNLIVFQCWSAVHGLASLMITMTDMQWPDRDALIDHVADSLMRGLRPAEAT